MKSGVQQGTVASREALQVIIAERLELEEEWYPHDGFSYFSGKIRNRRNFEEALKLLLETGCRWDVLLTCFARVLSYNLEDVRPRPKISKNEAVAEPNPPVERDSNGFSYFADLEAPLELKPRYVPKIMPAAAEERKRLRAHLQAASNVLKRYDTLLFELAMYLPFNDSGLGPELTPVEAHLLLPRLLSWSEKLLTEQSIGNARTIQTVGELVPCVYVELLASRQKGRSIRGILPWLQPVAEILNELEGEKVLTSRSTKKSAKPRVFSNDQLAEALRRFKRDYPNVYHQLRHKLSSLHDEPRPQNDDWHQTYVRDIADPRSRR